MKYNYIRKNGKRKDNIKFLEKNKNKLTLFDFT